MPAQREHLTSYSCMMLITIEGPSIFDRKVELRVVLNSIRCIQVIKKISGRTDI